MGVQYRAPNYFMRDIKENITKEFIPNIHYELLDDIRDKFFEFSKKGHDLLDPNSKKAKEELVSYLRSQYHESYLKIKDFKKTEKINKNSFAFKEFLKSNYTEDQIKYFATCSILADLIEAGFYIRLSREGFSIRKPLDSINKNQKPEDLKDQIRDFHLGRRDEQIKSFEVQNFLERMEKPKKVGNELKSVLDVIDNGSELAELFKSSEKMSEDDRFSYLKNLIKPELVPCYPDDYFKEESKLCPYTRLRLIDIWRYVRLTWSIELKSVPGRSFPFLIRNAARPNKPIMGITLFRSPAISDKARDSFIGWRSEKQIRQKIYTGELPIEEFVKSLINHLNSAINEVYIKDFISISKKNLRYPNQELIDYLIKIDKKKTSDRIDDLEVENYQSKNKIDSSASHDFETLATTNLFTAKRARRLAQLLEIQIAFNEHDLYSNAAKGYASLTYNQKGQDLIERLIREVRIRALSENFVDIGVCGAIAPYNEILAGKLMALLMASKECHEAYSERYKNQISQISSQVAGKEIVRKANLFAFTTTSLYSIGASQYNRLKLYKKDHPEIKEDIKLNEIFDETDDSKTSMTSAGLGTHHISEPTTRLLEACKILIQGHDNVTFTFGEGTSPKLRSLSSGLRLLIHSESDIANKDFLMHSFKRKNYIMVTHKNPLKKLLIPGNEEKLNLSSIDEISQAWLRRWVVKRCIRKETLFNLKKLNAQYVKSLFIRVPSNKNVNEELFPTV